MDIQDLLSSVDSALEALRETVESNSDLGWTPSTGFLPLVRRAILRRQFDSLEAVAWLVREGRGYAAVPLLRPSCEELIWLRYLGGIASTDAEELLTCSGSAELFHTLQAQDEYAGRAVTKELGLLSYLQDSNARQETVGSRLRALGIRLGWDRRTTDAGRIPSVAFLAKRTGQQKLYNFLYHATSRFVHFSVPELLRRAWGRPDSVSIRSIHFHDYWSAFALHWGIRLFLDSLTELVACGELSYVQFDTNQLLTAADRIGRFGQVPIVTAEELAWPTEPPRP